jgi:hypothetical protein
MQVRVTGVRVLWVNDFLRVSDFMMVRVIGIRAIGIWLVGSG